jgi:hypothetical protein
MEQELEGMVKMLYKCTDGDPSCGEWYNCMDRIARKPVACKDKSWQCLDNANRGPPDEESSESDDEEC